jgi:uroporphyrinogen decarboxylase
MSPRETMASEERLEALRRGAGTDRVPFCPFILGYCARNLGYPTSATYQDAEKSFYSQWWTRQMYGYDVTPLYFYASYGAWEFGGDVRMPGSQWEQAPMVTRFPVETEEDVATLAQPDVERAGSLPIAMAFGRLQARHRLPIFGPPQVGVLTCAGNVAGVSRLSRWMIRRPEVVHQLMRKVTDHLVSVMRLWTRTWPPASILPFVGEPTASNQILSPRQFEEFVLPYQRECNEKMLDMGIPQLLVHICGDQKLNLVHWQKIPFARDGRPGLLSFDHRVGVKMAIEHFPEHVIAGDIEPRLFQEGTPQEVYDSCVRTIEIGKQAPVGFALMTGCELPVQAVPYNLFVMGKALRQHGYYDD